MFGECKIIPLVDVEILVKGSKCARIGADNRAYLLLFESDTQHQTAKVWGESISVLLEFSIWLALTRRISGIFMAKATGSELQITLLKQYDFHICQRNLH